MKLDVTINELVGKFYRTLQQPRGATVEEEEALIELLDAIYYNLDQLVYFVFTDKTIDEETLPELRNKLIRLLDSDVVDKLVGKPNLSMEDPAESSLRGLNESKFNKVLTQILPQ